MTTALGKDLLLEASTAAHRFVRLRNRKTSASESKEINHETTEVFYPGGARELIPGTARFQLLPSFLNKTIYVDKITGYFGF